MRYFIKILSLTSLILVTLTGAGCTKQETDLIRNESAIYKITSDINADSLESYVNWMQNIGTRFTLADSRRQVALAIKEKFIRFGYTDVVLDSFWLARTYRQVYYQQWQYNIVATLHADQESDSICVMGGHYDNILSSGDPFSVVPGANDNASGVAVAMEVARVLKKNNFVPENTIKFVAFGAEELGLHGSNYFAGNAFRTVQRIKLMLNNDMVAYEPDNNKANWRVNIIDYDNSHYLRKEAEILCEKFTVLKPYNDNTYNKQSDSYPFFLNGYRALFFFSGKMDPEYHTLDDVVTNCNFEYCREIAIISCALLINKN